jgi:hypothetical protein
MDGRTDARAAVVPANKAEFRVRAAGSSIRRRWPKKAVICDAVRGIRIEFLQTDIPPGASKLNVDTPAARDIYHALKLLTGCKVRCWRASSDHLPAAFPNCGRDGCEAGVIENEASWVVACFMFFSGIFWGVSYPLCIKYHENYLCCRRNSQIGDL